MQLRSLIFLAGIASSTLLRGEVRLPAVFGNNLVLQQGQPLPIWGWADPAERVTITLGEANIATTQADPQGKWRVTLKAVRVTGQPLELVVSGKNTITLTNLLAGEVWICSGQSNMERALGSRPPQRRVLGDAEAIEHAQFPQIRMFTVQKAVSDTPSSDCKGRWVVCSPETVGSFSAVGYFFAEKLHEELNVPIGMIHTSWGGTVAEAWTRLEALEKDPMFKPILERRQTTAANSPNRAAVLYNGMVAPLIPYAIRGVVWYQGESNVPRAWQYRTLFPTMIRNWREDWDEGDFPFYYVQIAPFRYGNQDPKNCAELWEAQTQTLSLPHTGMAVTVDISDVKDIHPPYKREVGRRLALWALAKDYGRNLVYSGPLYKNTKTSHGRIVVYFNYAGSGLTTRDNKPPSDFQIAGADQNFVDAHAEIRGGTVVVWSESVTHPVAVRYAWRDTAEPNLMNRAGLPASPFRTDTWPAITLGKN